MSSPRPARRPRRRLVGAALFAWPVLEIAILIQVAVHAGPGAVVLLLLGGAVAGGLVLRRAGAGVLRRPPATTEARVVGAAGRPPAETALLVVAGVLLVLPGLLSDVVGLVLLLPAARRWVARRAGAAVLRRVQRLQVAGQVRVVRGEVVDDAWTVRDVTVRDVTDVPPADGRSGPALPTGR